MRSPELPLPVPALTLSVPALVFLVPLLLSGCSDSPSGSDGDAQEAPESSIDLAQDWGGLDDRDEAPNFNEPEMDQMAESQAASEPLAADPRVASLENQPERRVIFLRAVWGNLARNDPDSTAGGATIEWDGSISTTSGALLVQNLIRFEREDRIIRPRTDLKVVGFASRTHGGVDGLLLRLVFHPDSTDPADQVTFDTGPVDISFPLSAIADVDTVITVGNNGNGLAITAVDDDRRGPCAAGLVNGAWRFGLEGGGYFRAVWLTPNGFVAAVMRGRFGQRPDGRPVLLGKVITPAGRFMGFIRGDFSNEGGHGGWRALWFGRERLEPIGRLGGHWVSRPGTEGGFLHGRWARNCPGENQP